MTIQIKFWESNAKANRPAWVVRLGNKKNYFSTKEKAQKFLETINTVEATDPGMTLDTLVGSVPSKKDGGLKSFEANLSYNGNPLDFVSEQRVRYDRELIVWKQYQHLAKVGQAMCDVVVEGKRLGSFKVYEITGAIMRREVLRGLEKDRSQKTLKEYWNGMSLIFDFAVTEKLIITVNPCNEKVKFEKYGKLTGKEGKVRRVTTENVNAIIAAMPHSRSNENREILDWRLMVNFAAQTGLRQGEQRALQWADLDLEKQVVCVSHSMSSREDGDNDLAGTKADRLKNRNQLKTRTISLSDLLTAHLKEWFMFCGCPNAEEYVWNEKSGEALGANRFSRMMARVCSRIQIEPVLWHELRHYYAAERLMRNRVEPVSRALGHANTKITEEIYGHFIRDDKFDKEELESANNSSLVMVQVGAS